MVLSLVKSLAIISNFVAFLATIKFNKQANTVSKLFPRKTGDVSKRFETEITPATTTFIIWAFIYLFQAAWIIYSLSLLFRSDAPDILPARFYVYFAMSCFLNVAWLVVWAHEMFNVSLIIISLFALNLQACLFVAYQSLDEYLQQVPDNLQSPIDIWCIRTFVQNGIMLYAAWVSIATCINLAIYLQTGLHLHKSKAATIALVALLTAVLTWFLLENLVFDKYTRFTFTEYVVLLVGLSGILRRQWTDGHGNQLFVLAIFVLSAVLFVTRLLIITMK